MALADAVLAVAAAMENEMTRTGSSGEFNWPEVTQAVVRSFARELRTAVRAAEAAPLSFEAGESKVGFPGHRAQIEAIKAEMRRQRRDEINRPAPEAFLDQLAREAEADEGGQLPSPER